VRIGADTASTDGSTIHLPTIRNEPGAKSLAWGYLAHEAGHIRHTDFQVWSTLTGQPLTRSITNILEDVRIENAMIGSYPGTRLSLDAVLDWMVHEGKIAAPSADSSPPMVLVNALLVLARHRYRRQAALRSPAQGSERVLRRVFPPSFVHRLLGLTSEIAALKSTADSADLARRIVALIQEEAEQQPSR
jgi:cobaltochelatase CobT